MGIWQLKFQTLDCPKQVQQIRHVWAQHRFKEGLLDHIIDPNIKRDLPSDSLNVYVDVAIKCLHCQPKLRPTMAEVVVGLESALTLHEKSTHYSLVEIMPIDSTQDLDSSILEVKDTNHNRKYEYTGEGNVNVSNGWHRNKQSSAIMTFTKRVSVLLSVTARAFSVNKDAKTSRYSNGVLSVNGNKSQAANLRTSLPVYPLVSPTPWTQEEVLQSSKLKSFTLNDLRVATWMFSPDSLLGEGGFGCVYKGWIVENTFAAAKWGTGQVIAVKTLNATSSQGHREWLTEIKYLGTLCHPNLVKLIGHCLEEEHRLLVYEFMPQGSLEKHLFKKDSYFQPLPWNLRMSIALGAAKGLAYLHSPEARVIYRDFKTSNILLDSKYNAKLSDFGLAKDGPENEYSYVTTRIMGTYGYAAPEYLTTGHLTMKSDVYAFGVVLLEILTGERVNDRSRPTKKKNLVDWAKPYLTSKHRISYVMDAHIQGQYTVKEALRASSLALKCLSEDPRLRPDTNQVVKELEQLQGLKNWGISYVKLS